MTYLTFPQLERVGRLGNQLWQIASTIGLARRHGLEPRFPASWSYRPFFCVPDSMFGDVSSGTDVQSLDDLLHMDWRTRIYLQDLSFIAGVEDEIRAYFRPGDEAVHAVAERVPIWLNNLVIHVRRGDNLVQQDCYPVPTLDYYLAAVDRHPDRAVVIFGDDFSWNANVLVPSLRSTDHPDRRIAAVKGTPRPKEHEADYMTAPILDWVDLHAMRYTATSVGAFCLSNSTLGWWAAWLSGSQDVCYPDPWYGPDLDINQHGYIDGSLMMPSNWQKVPFQVAVP